MQLEICQLMQECYIYDIYDIMRNNEIFSSVLDTSVMFEDDVVDLVKDFISVRHDENLIPIHYPV
jgi:hypothetical protein